MTIDQQDIILEYSDGRPNATALSDNLVVPLISEEVHIDKQWVETGRTRLIKEINERAVPVSVELLREETDIERISLNRPVDKAPEVRYEGDTMIIPILKEEYIVVKQLILVEEVRVTKRKTTETMEEMVLLRSEELRVEHTETNPVSNHSII